MGLKISSIQYEVISGRNFFSTKSDVFLAYKQSFFFIAPDDTAQRDRPFFLFANRPRPVR